MIFISAIEFISNNLGIAYPDLILVVIMCFVFFFYAIDLRLGIMLTFIASSLLFVVFYELGIDYNHTILFFLLSFGLLVLSLYFTAQRTGGYI